MAQGWTCTTGDGVLLYCSALVLGMSLTLAIVSFVTPVAPITTGVTSVLVAVVALMTMFGILCRSRSAKQVSR